MVTLADASGQTKTAFTNSFGYYQFTDTPSGETYILNVSHKRHAFAPRVLFAGNEITDADFTEVEK